MNKKGQIIIDAEAMPKWVLYPLLIIVGILLALVAVILVLFIISWVNGDAQFMPFGMFGYYGMPLSFGSFHTASYSSIMDTSNSSECFLNGIKISCNNLSIPDGWAAWENSTS
jgi:hypothetical protein